MIKDLVKESDLGVRRGKRQGKSEAAALPGALALGPDATAMRLDQTLGDGKADPTSPRSSGARRVDAVEAIEDMGEIIRVNAYACILNSYS